MVISVITEVTRTNNLIQVCLDKFIEQNSMQSLQQRSGTDRVRITYDEVHVELQHYFDGFQSDASRAASDDRHSALLGYQI